MFRRGIVVAGHPEEWDTETGGFLMKFLFTLYRDEDGVYIAECPSIPGCVSQGETPEDAENNIREAIKECLAVREELGLPLTVATHEVEVPV